MAEFFTRHEALLKRAVEAIGARTYFSAYPESASPKVYGENAKAEGDAAFEALLGKPFEFDDRFPSERLVGAEASPLRQAARCALSDSLGRQADRSQRRGRGRLGGVRRSRRAPASCSRLLRGSTSRAS